MRSSRRCRALSPIYRARRTGEGSSSIWAKSPRPWSPKNSPRFCASKRHDGVRSSGRRGFRAIDCLECEWAAREPKQSGFALQQAGWGMGSDSLSQTIGARLSAVAQVNPDSIAVVEQETQLAFAQLDADAGAIARRIVATSRGRRGVVCLLFESKLRAVKAIFGACRSGYAYVPLDARDP